MGMGSSAAHSLCFLQDQNANRSRDLHDNNCQNNNYDSSMNGIENLILCLGQIVLAYTMKVIR